MLAKILKWIFICLLVLAVLWPSPAGYPILLAAVAVCAGAILAAQARRAGKYFWLAGHARVSREVK
jgi:Na+/H+ antiporter NhaD/arsenite permease-like protein